MDQIVDFFKGLFSTHLWPARWHCGLWSDFHGWLYITSDLMIWSAYFAMPLIIVSYISRKKNSKFLPVYFLFAAFILACGTTHLLDAITFWYPMYRLNALVRFVTGVISWVTVYYLVKMVPIAFALKSPELLEAEVEQRKKVEEQLRRSLLQLNDAQDIARMGHWDWDIPAGLITCSDTLSHIYEYPPHGSSLSYDEFLALIHPDDRENVDDLLRQAIDTGEFKEYYHRIITPGGSIKTIHSRGKMMLDENRRPVQILGTEQDVTEQKNTEYELIIKSNNLEAANTELQKFAYVASHDLQEPLRKINIYNNRLRDEYATTYTDKQNTYLDKITSATSRMQTLIKDILDFSQLNSAGITYQKTNLNEIIRQVISDMEITIEKTSASISIADIPSLDANPTQMRQLFQNLLGNAIKFMKPDVNPHIDISAQIVYGGQVESAHTLKAHYKFSEWNEDRYWNKEKFCKITIQDNGIGFESEFAQRIFIVFQRLDSDRLYEGTGIGLAICKKIIENHHGLISASSSPGAGARFEIVMPISQAHFEANF